MKRSSANWRRCVLLAQLLVFAVLALRSSQRAAAAAPEEGDDPPDRVARLSALGGSVSFQPAGESEWALAAANRPVTTGDRLWTEASARAELDMGSATVRLGANTDFAFVNLDDHVVQLQVTQGAVVVHVRRLNREEIVEVDTPNLALSILQAGSYRVEASEDGSSTLVTVRDGEAEASGGGGTYALRAGQTTSFTGTDDLTATFVPPGRADALDAWSDGRDRRAEGSASARHVSPQVVGYEDLDDNGTWRTDPSYGDVWFPTRVAQDWAPYHDGHWAWISPWGYTWVDDAPWGYAPFHYGRWVTVEGRWAWVPGPADAEAVYAPALVAFVGGPSFSVSVSVGGGGSRGEVAWFPLGPREVYVPAHRVSRAYVERVNVSNTRVSTTTITSVYETQVDNDYRVTNVTYVNRTAPGAVTVVPQAAFASAQPVARAAVKVNAQRLAAAPLGAMAVAAPTRNAVFGNARPEGAPKPPPAAAGRSVVARAAPPPPAVPFARQQSSLEAHPGRPLARQEVEKVRPPATAAAQPLVRQLPPGKPGAGREERTPGPAKPAEQAAQPPASKPAEPVARTPAPAKPAEQVAQPPAPKPAEPVARTPAPAKPAEPAAQPPAPKPAQPVVRTPGPAKPAEQAAQPPAPKPVQPVVRTPGPAKPAEPAAQPPAPKPAQPVVRTPAPAKPAEPAAQPPAPRPVQPVVRTPDRARPVEPAVRRPEPVKPAKEVAQPPPPKAAARTPQQPERPSPAAERSRPKGEKAPAIGATEDRTPPQEGRRP